MVSVSLLSPRIGLYPPMSQLLSVLRPIPQSVKAMLTRTPGCLHMRVEEVPTADILHKSPLRPLVRHSRLHPIPRWMLTWLMILLQLQLLANKLPGRLAHWRILNGLQHQLLNQLHLLLLLTNKPPGRLVHWGIPNGLQHRLLDQLPLLLSHRPQLSRAIKALETAPRISLLLWDNLKLPQRTSGPQ